jgi:hypothetical protein
MPDILRYSNIKKLNIFIIILYNKISIKNKKNGLYIKI